MSSSYTNKTGVFVPGHTAFRQWVAEGGVSAVGNEVVSHDTALEESRSDTVVVSSALARPLVLTAPPSEVAPPPRVATPANPSGVVSYEDALAAVFANAGMAPEPPPPLPMAPLPAAPALCTPERVVAFLSELPRHLSQESRFQRMEEELQNYPNGDPNDLVGDAAAQLVSLRRELLQHTADHDLAVKSTQSRIELLEAELARMREQLAEREAEGQERRQVLLTQVDEMTGVIVFFDSYQSYLMRRAEQESGTEVVPTFVDEETALRLLERREES
jgi:hypothetical protein